MKFIANPFTPIPKHPKSHVRGWSEYWSQLLSAKIYRGYYDDLSANDTVYIDHGVNFSGGLNFFGGLSDDVCLRLQSMVDSGCAVRSLDMPMPDYTTQLRKRLGVASTSKLLTQELINSLDQALYQYRPITWNKLPKPTKWVTIGDSHATAFARKGASVFRTNGKTLHSFVNDPDIELGSKTVGVTFVFGSIDVRHHLLRHGPESYIPLLDAYINKVNRYIGSYRVEVAAPVPVEHEERKIPKTGYYLGKPFYGSYEERKKLTLDIMLYLRENLSSKVKLVVPPKNWYLMDSIEYANTIMELGGSVHIAPIHYRSWGAWDV